MSKQNILQDYNLFGILPDSIPNYSDFNNFIDELNRKYFNKVSIEVVISNNTTLDDFEDGENAELE